MDKNHCAPGCRYVSTLRWLDHLGRKQDNGLQQMRPQLSAPVINKARTAISLSQLVFISTLLNTANKPARPWPFK